MKHGSTFCYGSFFYEQKDSVNTESCVTSNNVVRCPLVDASTDRTVSKKGAVKVFGTWHPLENDVMHRRHTLQLQVT